MDGDMTTHRDDIYGDGPEVFGPAAPPLGASGGQQDWEWTGTTTGYKHRDEMVAAGREDPLFADEPDLFAGGGMEYDALRALMVEDTPEEAALASKDRGNDEVKKKTKAGYRAAVGHYTLGLEARGGDAGVNAALHANRAHAHLQLENFGRALWDCECCLRLQPGHVKALHRGATAALRLAPADSSLRRARRAAELALEGARQDPGNTQFLRLVADAEALLLKLQEARAAEDDRRRWAERMDEAIKRRALAVGPPALYADIVPGGKDAASVEQDARTGELHWPVLVLYPEFHESDFIQDVPETDAVAAHLDVLLADGVPWDAQGVYTRASTRLYYMTHCVVEWDFPGYALKGVRPSEAEEDAKAATKEDEVKPHTQEWVCVDERKTLGDVLKEPGHVLPGLPVFHALVPGTDAHAHFFHGQHCRGFTP